MPDRNDVALGYPEWNAYMDQLKRFQDEHGTIPPNQSEIYAACKRDDPDCIMYPIYIGNPNTYARHDERRRVQGLTWDAYMQKVMEETLLHDRDLLDDAAQEPTP